MVNRSISQGEGALYAHFRGHMARKRQPFFPGTLGDGLQGGERQAGVDFQKIVLGAFVFAHFLPALLGGFGAVAVEGRAGGVDPGAEDLPGRYLVLEHEVIGVAEHPAEQGDPVAEVEQHCFAH